MGVINPATPRAELLAHLIGVRRQLRKNLQGKRRMQMVSDSGTASTKSLRQRKRAATKREVDAIMERPCRSTLSAVTVGNGQRKSPKSAATTARGASGRSSRNGFALTTWRKDTRFTPWFGDR